MERLHTTILKFDLKEWEDFEAGKNFCLDDETWELRSVDALEEHMKADYDEYIRGIDSPETYDEYRNEVFDEYIYFFSVEEFEEHYDCGYGSDGFSYDVLKDNGFAYVAITIKY